jgi:hypothetical protein
MHVFQNFSSRVMSFKAVVDDARPIHGSRVAGTGSAYCGVLIFIVLPSTLTKTTFVVRGLNYKVTALFSTPSLTPTYVIL